MLDADQCYEALRSRDARFDGRFFVAVRSTGIYCRPVCPARTPARPQVRFVRSAAEAEADGFRACLRCRPETAPGSAAWDGTRSTVRRALRLIDEGALDSARVPELADRLGVGERHLRRLFVAHLGASPGAVARTRRLQLARSALLDTDLPMGDVASLAGFGSLRRFNSATLEAFGRTPTALRQARPRPPELRLRLGYRPPLPWAALLGFLRGRAIAGVEVVGDNSWAHTLRIGAHHGVVRVRPDTHAHRVELTASASLAPVLGEVVRQVRRTFDLDADPDPITAVLKRDPLLAPRLAPGLRVPGAFDPFAVAIRAVLGQQISVAAASTLAGRVVARFGDPVETGEDGLTHLFPLPEVLAGADLEALGLTRARAAAIRGLSEAVATGALAFGTRASLDATVGELVALRGIGPWTAHYLAMRVLCEPDAFPASDLGLRRSLGLDERALTQRAQAWRPWRAYAAMTLWSTGGGG